MDELSELSNTWLQDARNENRRLHRRLARRQWFWRCVGGAAVVTAVVMLCKTPEDKTEDEQ